MWKKLISSVFVIIIIISISTVGHTASARNATPKVIKVDKSKYQVITPSEYSSTPKKKVVLISGKAPEGTSITIEVYGAVDLTGKKYSLAKLPNKDDYILISDQTIKSGVAGFGEEVELVCGINKIIITFNVNGIPSVERILYYYEVEQVMDGLRRPSALPSMN